jgi:hypothetical protein
MEKMKDDVRSRIEHLPELVERIEGTKRGRERSTNTQSLSLATLRKLTLSCSVSDRMVGNGSLSTTSTQSILNGKLDNG